MRRGGGGGPCSNAESTAGAAGPETRITATALGGRPDASAAIVDAVTR
jgi:hypothetical protein